MYNNVVLEVERRFGGIDVLVNNSGATWGAPAEEMPPAKFDQAMRGNVHGTFLMCRAVGERMVERGEGGRIINISSVLGLLGGNPVYAQTIGYNSSKGAVISMTRDLALDWPRAWTLRTEPLRKPLSRRRDQSRAPAQRFSFGTRYARRYEGVVW